MDIVVNKPAKDFLKRKFERWYSDEVMKQLQCISDVQSAELQLVNLCMAAVKQLSAQWLVEMAEYIADNPQFLVNGFRRAGISNPLDYSEHSEEESGEDSDMLSDDFDTDEGFSFESNQYIYIIIIYHKASFIYLIPSA